MIRKTILTGLCAAALAGCSGDGNPFTTPGDGTGGIADPLPGTETPTADDGITRTEEADDDGNGTARDFAYDAETDTFTVGGIAFDDSTGASDTYRRSVTAPRLGPFAVYENAGLAVDPSNDRGVFQLRYRALYGESASGNARFAVVRTGSYTDYGFGGFLYERDGGVTIPSSGQAAYVGRYAGMRDFDGKTGLEYTAAKAEMTIDFAGFDEGNGVRALFSNRQIYDANGTPITGEVLAALNEGRDPGDRFSALPVVRFEIGPGTTDANGEMQGVAFSRLDEQTRYEEGNFYALMSGGNAEEIVGIVVLESDDPRFDVTARETGGFIAYR